MQWENVYVFISSTFNDMHAERDYLVKKVFPVLSAWCEERKLRLVDIDLRWGVSEADATENKRVVQVCLDRIDASRPFFLCFLGQRRGWVPSREDISDDTYASFPKLAEKYAGDTSVTELEILHALVDPLQNAQSDEYAFFYLRDPDYLNSFSDNNKIRLLDVYTNRADADAPGADAQLTRWRESVIPGTGRPAYRYTADWDESEQTHEIALPLYCPTTAAQGSAAWQSAFAKWKAVWQSAGVTVGENGEITDPSELEKAKAYNEAFTRGRLTNFCTVAGERATTSDDCETDARDSKTAPGDLVANIGNLTSNTGDAKTNPNDLASVIIADLKAAITARYGERTADVETPLQKELDQQAQFLQVASEGFIEREGDFDALNAYLADDRRQPFALTAYAGMGKTSLLAHFIDTHSSVTATTGLQSTPVIAAAEPQSTSTLHYRFVGGSDDSVSAERLVRSLLSELKEAGKITSDIPASATDMMNKLPQLLVEAGTAGQTILIIDALNQLESGMSDLSWIPAELPENVKLIVSFKRGEADAEQYYTEAEQGGTMILHAVKPIDSLNDRKKLVTAYLDKYFKELDEPRIEALIGSDGAGNPLFLKIALSELRVFGVHNDLSAVIRDSFGDTPVKAFGAVLARMENDPAYSGVAPEILLPHILGWLAHSRYGLAVYELSDLLIREGLTNDPETANDAVYLVLRQLRPYFAKRDGRVDFFYESFKIAATERYTGDYPNARSAAEWHKSLAEYFETLPLEHRHRLMEQAWQYANAGMGEALNTLLCDYEFLDVRLRLFDIDALLGDMSCIHFDSANLDDNGLSLLKLIEGSLTLSVSILAADKGQLAAHLWARLADFEDEPIRRLLDQAVSVKRARREAWFRPLKACLPKPGGALVRTFMGNPGSGTAFAQGQDELVFSERSLGKIVRMNAITGKTIQVLPSSTSGKLIYQPEFHRILTYEHASLYLIDCIDGSRQGFLHTMPTIIANEFFAVKNVLVATCFGNKDIFIFNISEKKLVKIISGYSGSRGKVLTSDGKYLITGFDDNSVRVWDTSSGECVQVLRAHSSVPDNIIIDENSDRLYTYCKEDHTFCWDMRSWHLLYRIPVDIESGSVIAHNSRFLANPTYGGIDLYNLETGEMIKQFTFIGASCCIFNHDDSLLIVGSERGGICIYNITEMKECGGFAGHPQGVVILCLSTDEQFLISKANDFSIRVWDMKFTTAYKDAEDIYFGMKTLGDGNQLLALKNNIYAETEKIWEVKKSEVMLFDMLTAQCVNSYPTMSGAGANISICGEQDLFALSYVDIVDLYKLSTGENVKRVQYNNGLNSEENQRFIGEFYFTENMNQMIGVGYSEQHGYHILIVDIEKEEIANRFPINTSSVEFSVLTENGAKAVIASDILSNRKVQFVDTESGKTSSVLEENPSINAIGFNKNKTKIIIRAYENSLMIYDCRNGKRLYSIKVMPYPFSQDIAQISLSKKNNFLLGYVNSSSIIGVYATDICTGEPFTRFLGEQTIFDMACSDDNSSIALISQSMLSFLRLENFDDAILDLHASASTDELANLQRFKEIWDSDDIEIKTDDIPAQTENAKGGLFSGLFRGKKNHV